MFELLSFFPFLFVFIHFSFPLLVFFYICFRFVSYFIFHSFLIIYSLSRFLYVYPSIRTPPICLSCSAFFVPPFCLTSCQHVTGWLSIFYLSSLHTNSCTRMCQWMEDSLPPPLPPRFTPPTSCTCPPFSSL